MPPSSREAQYLADVVLQALRAHPDAVVVFRLAAEAVAVADLDIERLVGAENHSPGHAHPRVLPRVGDEDLLDVLELAAVEPPARNSECLPFVAAVLQYDMYTRWLRAKSG